MDESLLTHVEAPRFETGRSILIAGLQERFTPQTTTEIPALWQRFVPHLGKIPGQVGSVTYGIVVSADNTGNMEYLCGVEVSDFAGVPKVLTRFEIPAQRYAVFTHREHITTIKNVWFTIWKKWLPESGHQAAKGPAFERYDERFDPATGNGGFEVWIPIER